MKKLKYNFKCKKTKLGRVSSGNVVQWDNELWLVLNPVVEKNSKLLRSLVGEHHRSFILDTSEKVNLLTFAKRK